MVGRSHRSGHRLWPVLTARGWPARPIARHVRRVLRLGRLRLVRLSEAQGHRCAYCQRPTWIRGYDAPGAKIDQATTEHVVPISLGGSESPFNKVMACYGCNQRRSDRDIDEFMQEVDSRHGPFIPGYYRRHLKHQARLGRRVRDASQSEAYGALIWGLAVLFLLNPDARRLADEITPGGRLHRPSRLSRSRILDRKSQEDA